VELDLARRLLHEGDPRQRTRREPQHNSYGDDWPQAHARA
jgi:hypothetical protein